MVYFVVLALFSCADTGPSREGTADASVDSDADIEPDARGDTPDLAEDVADEPEGDASLMSVESILQSAGQSEDEATRYELLASLLDHPELGEPLRMELESLLPTIDRWANGRERFWEPGDQPTAGEGGYLAGFFHLQVWPDLGAATFPPRVEAESPLYPIWALYRGRMLIWSGIQTGSFVNSEEGRETWFGEGRALMSVAFTAFPDNRVIGMYLDEPVVWDALEPDSDAPAWANLQREATNKILDIVEFWIDERQASDGQFGGGWGDDVEMWRWWTPLLVAFDHSPIVDAQERLSTGIFALPRLEQGYSSILTDVEHSSEDSSDAISAMLLARPEDPIWEARADRISTMARDRWMARNERGFLQFLSTYFTPDTVSTNRAYACDTVYHTRALQPVLHRWQTSGDSETGALITDWLDTWVDAAARAERDKPAGVLPSAIHWPSGEVGGPGSNWWEPGCAQNEGAFDFPSALSLLAEALVLAWHMSGDDHYLEPIRSMAELRRGYLESPPDSVEEGTADWVASRLARITDALVRYRAVSGDDAYDDLIVGRADGYVRYRLTGETEGLMADLTTMVESLRINQAGYTTEVRYTDRIRKFAGNYANHYAEEPLPTLNTDLLYEMLSGDLGDPLYFPQPAVRWATSPRDFAAWVTAADADEFEAEVYVFDADRTVHATFPSLEPGSYAWTLECGEPWISGAFDVEPNGIGTAEISAPSRAACTLRVTTAP